MSDPLQQFTQPVDLSATAFPATSRYHGLEIAQFTRADGTIASYVRRRFVPAPEKLALLQEHTIQQGDRLDLLASRHLGDPELFWQICDANRAMRPNELVKTPGRVLRITLPEGVPGGSGG